VTELIVSDYSEKMLQVAAHKVAELRATKQPQPSQVTLAVADAGALPLPDGQFDTIVDTFGICSFGAPAPSLPHPNTLRPAHHPRIRVYAQSGLKRRSARYTAAVNRVGRC